MQFNLGNIPFLNLMQWFVQGSTMPWRIRHTIALAILQRILPADRVVVDGYLGRYHIIFDLNDKIQRDIYMGFYEPIETRLLKEHLKSGDVFLDIGANVGYYSLIASQVVGYTGQVHAFEPISENISVLNRTISDNSISNIRTNETAVGNSNGTITLHMDNYLTLGNSVWASINASEARKIARQVKMISIDEYIAARAVAQINMVKIDVEGMEFDVLQGMQSLLSRYGPDILCEVFPKNSVELTTYLSGFGYTLYPLPFVKALDPGTGITSMTNLFCTKDPAKMKGLGFLTSIKKLRSITATHFQEAHKRNHTKSMPRRYARETMRWDNAFRGLEGIRISWRKSSHQSEVTDLRSGDIHGVSTGTVVIQDL